MYNNGEAAEQMFRMALNGAEVAAKISGKGAVKLIAYLTAVMKDQKKTKGKARLTAMLKSGRPLDVFSVRKEDMKAFVTEAKKYGILYCCIKSKLSNDGMSDIMVRREDSPRINHIVERLKFGMVDMASIETDIQKGKDIPDPDKGVEEKSVEVKQQEQTADKPTQKEAQQTNEASNSFFQKGREKNRPSEHSSAKMASTDRNNDSLQKEQSDRPSVRQVLKDIQAEQKNQPVKKKRTRQKPKEVKIEK